MSKTYYFISGLPRSGSTLTSAILRQNPRFHAGMTGPVSGLFEGMISQVSAGTELSTMVSTEQRKRLLEGLFDSYHGIHQEDVVFDTSRSWTTKLPALLEIFPQTKMICLVRDVSWIMDSMERQFRKNPFENTKIFANQQQRATVYSRVETMGGPNSIVGYPWNALREACYSEHAEHLLLVDYDLLVSKPEDVFKAIYQFLGEPYFEHDFSNVAYDAPEFDAQLGMDGLHRVHPKVEKRSRETILPPDLFGKYDNMTFWRDMKHSKAYCLVPENNN